MGLTMFTLPDLFAPLRRLLARIPARSQACTSRALLARTGLHTGAGRAHVAWPAPGAQTRRPLRVLRVVDAGHGPSTAGRMVISGRMADVCAELDRLAALEAVGA